MATHEDWNTAIVGHLFNPSRAGKVVALGLGDQDLDDIGRTMPKGPMGVPEFIEAVAGVRPTQIIARAQGLHSVWRRTPDEDPPFVAHLALLVHALLSEKTATTFPTHNVYGKINALLKQKRGTKWDLSPLVPLWLDLADWANGTQAGNRGRLSLYRYGEMKWVAWLRGQAILTPRDRDALTWVFLEEGIPPGQAPADHILASALSRATANGTLASRVSRVLDDAGGKALLLQQVADVLLSWDGEGEGPDPRQAGDGGSRGLRLLLASEGGVPQTGNALPSLGLRLRVPGSSHLILPPSGMVLADGHLGSIRIAPGPKTGISGLLSLPTGVTLSAAAAGWPRHVRVGAGRLRASRLPSERAILRQPRWASGLVEVDEPSDELEPGEPAVLITTGVEAVLEQFSFLPRAAEWQLIANTDVRWVRWAQDGRLSTAEFLGTGHSRPPVTGLTVHRWPKTERRGEHLAELPLLVETPSELLLVQGGRRERADPVGGGVFVLLGLSKGPVTLDPVVGPSRTVYVNDLPPMVDPHLRVSPENVPSPSGIAGALVDYTVRHTATPALPQTARCPHLGAAGRAGADNSLGARVLAAVSAAGAMDWGGGSGLRALVEDLSVADPGSARWYDAVAHELLALGHIEEVSDGDGTTHLVPAPPLFGRLPSHSDRYVLCGARTATFLSDVVDACEAAGVATLLVPRGPTSIAALFADGGDREMDDVAYLLSDRAPSLNIAHEPPAHSLLAAYPDLLPRLGELDWAPWPPDGTWDGWDGYETDRRGWAWKELTDGGVPPVDALPTVVYYQKRTAMHQRLVALRDGQVMEAQFADRAEGQWSAIVMADEAQACVFYDAESAIAGFREFPPLPWLLARSLTLCSGIPPFRLARPAEPPITCFYEVAESFLETVVDKMGIERSHIRPAPLSP